MPRMCSAALAATLVALAAPAAASALVQVDRGIAGARLGNTRELRSAPHSGSRPEVITGTHDVLGTVRHSFARRDRVRQ